jgi:hypothetical protein
MSQQPLFDIAETPWSPRNIEQHPQLAALSALYATADASKLALAAAHQKIPNEEELGYALEQLFDILNKLNHALHAYYQGLHRAEPPRPIVPTTWSPQQANSVFMFLHRVAEAVWEAHEHDLVEIAKHEENMTLHDDGPPF